MHRKRCKGKKEKKEDLEAAVPDGGGPGGGPGPGGGGGRLLPAIILALSAGLR